MMYIKQALTAVTYSIAAVAGNWTILVFCHWLCLFVTLLQIASSFLFLDGIEPFLAISSPCMALHKSCSSIFWFRPPNAQILVPKICTKSPISRLVWQIDRICLGLPGGFRGSPIKWNHVKCCGADPCCLPACHSYCYISSVVYIRRKNSRFSYFSVELTIITSVKCRSAELLCSFIIWTHLSKTLSQCTA